MICFFCLTIEWSLSLSFKQSCLCAARQTANQTRATDFRVTLVAFTFVIV